jgi:ABC-type amino acid transport substrate-binding protein
MSYNGWSNYETWNLALWMDNDQGTYSMRCEAVSDAVNDNDDKEDAVSQVAKWLESLVENGELGELPANGFLSDILSNALREVDYDEIAQNWVDDAWEDKEEEEEAEAEEVTE